MSTRQLKAEQACSTPVLKITLNPCHKDCTNAVEMNRKVQSIEPVFQIPHFRAAVLTMDVTNTRGSVVGVYCQGSHSLGHGVGALNLEVKCPQYFLLRLMASVQRKVN